jgi:hypothetical protein
MHPQKGQQPPRHCLNIAAIHDGRPNLSRQYNDAMQSGRIFLGVAALAALLLVRVAGDAAPSLTMTGPPGSLFDPFIPKTLPVDANTFLISLHFFDARDFVGRVTIVRPALMRWSSPRFAALQPSTV